MAAERTLVLIKPDAMRRGLAGQILQRFEARGLELREARLLTVERALAEEQLGIRDPHSMKITDPLTKQWWGDKTFKVMGPYGYELWFYQTVGEPKPPQGAKIV